MHTVTITRTTDRETTTYVLDDVPETWSNQELIAWLDNEYSAAGINDDAEYNVEDRHFMKWPNTAAGWRRLQEQRQRNVVTMR